MIVLLLACTYVVDLDDTGVEVHGLPRLEVSPAAIDFGVVTQGTTVGPKPITITNAGSAPLAVTLDEAKGDRGFCVLWAAEQPACVTEELAERRSASRRASARGAGAHTGGAAADTAGGGDTGGPDTGEGERGCGGRSRSGSGAARRLEPGCVAAGEVYFSPVLRRAVVDGAEIVSVELADEPDTMDTRNGVQHVRLDGASSDVAALQVIPPAAVLDWHTPDGVDEEVTLTVGNVGAVPLSGLLVDDRGSCPPEVSWDAPFSGGGLEPGETSTLTVRATPTTSSVACRLQLTATGVSSMELLVLQNPPPWSAPPTVVLTDPAPGTLLDGTAAFSVSLTLADDLDAPSALGVTIYGDGAWLTSGAPADDSGSATFVVPARSLRAGFRVLEVVVEDRRGDVARVSVPVRVDDLPAVDADGDGQDPAEGDCDDTSTAVYAGATEAADGLDNDCDGAVDEDTPVSDDDGDGYTEADGDCDDTDPRAAPGLPERADWVDNDCNGTADEGTSLGDDDGDGDSEADGDCDDADAAVSPAAVELCDGLDNDCDGLKDSADGCIGDVDPMVGYLDVEPDGCVHGETVALTLQALPATGLTVAWYGESPLATPTSVGDAVSSVPCPAVSDVEWLNRAVGATVSDRRAEVPAAAGLTAWSEAAAPWLHPGVGEAPALTTPCAPRGGAVVAFAAAVFLVSAGVRRRRG